MDIGPLFLLVLGYNLTDVGTDTWLTIKLFLSGHPAWGAISLVATLFGIFTILSSLKCMGRLYKWQRGSLQVAKGNYFDDDGLRRLVGLSHMSSYLFIYKFTETIPEAVVRILASPDVIDTQSTVGIITTLIGCIQADLAIIVLLGIYTKVICTRISHSDATVASFFFTTIPALILALLSFTTTILVIRLLFPPVSSVPRYLRIIFYVVLGLSGCVTLRMMYFTFRAYVDGSEEFETSFDMALAKFQLKIKNFLCCSDPEVKQLDNQDSEKVHSAAPNITKQFDNRHLGNRIVIQM